MSVAPNTMEAGRARRMGADRIGARRRPWAAVRDFVRAVGEHLAERAAYEPIRFSPDAWKRWGEHGTETW